MTVCSKESQRASEQLKSLKFARIEERIQDTLDCSIN